VFTLASHSETPAASGAHHLQTTLEPVRHWWFNRPDELKQTTRKHKNTFCVASAAVSHETGNFTQRQRLKTRPSRACLKAFFEGIPVPVRERE
jgi:hypothetical protein